MMWKTIKQAAYVRPANGIPGEHGEILGRLEATHAYAHCHR